MVISTTLHTDPVPLCPDEYGGLRVGNSRIHLETVIRAYREGDSPETIAQHFTTLELADIYAVIAYYLRHQDEVEEYLRQRQEQAATIRKEIEAAQGSQVAELRAKIKARWVQREQEDDAPTGK